MKYVVFDTETTSLFHFKRPVNDPSQPWIIQLAAILYDGVGNEIESLEVYVMPPEGEQISPDAIAIHGITMGTLRDNNAITQTEMLDLLRDMVNKCDTIVGYNVPFDIGMVNAAESRLHPNKHLSDPMFGVHQEFCVMRYLTPICKMLPKRFGTYKWPKLEEAAPLCLGAEHKGAHDAMADVLMTEKLFEYCMMLEVHNAKKDKDNGSI